MGSGSPEQQIIPPDEEITVLQKTGDGKEVEHILHRSEFGSGHTGQKSWNLIKAGATCIAHIESVPCGQPAIGTTDIDVFWGDVELFPHCSENHSHLIIQQVKEQLELQAKHVGIPRLNGNGRW